MHTASSDSMVKDTLKNLSCDNGWSYGVFWRFDKRNSSLLTLQGAYYEKHMGGLVDDMILQVHSLGEGVIGEVALNKRHKWMMADAHSGTSNPAESVESSDIFQDHQFSIGIKTIAVISVEPLGVVQFGSTEKVPETLEFVNQTKELFQGIEIIEGLIFPESEQSYSTTEDTRERSELFTSSLSSMNPHCASPNLQRGDSCNYLVEVNCSTANLRQSFPSTTDFLNMNAKTVAASSLCGNHFRIANTESQGHSDGSVSDILLQQLEMEPSTFFGFSSSGGPCSNPWSFGDIEESSILNSGYSNDLFADAVKTSTNCSNDTIISQNFGSSFHPSTGQVQCTNTLDTFEELLGKNNSNNALSKYCAMEDVSHWFAPLTDQSNGMVATALSHDLSNASGVFSLSPSPKGYHTPTKLISDNQSSTSVQSSITNSFDFAEREKCVDMFGSGKLLQGPRMDLGASNYQDEESILMPGVSCALLNFSASSSECVSELYANRRIGTTSTLFSKLGLYQHFDDIAGDTFSVARSDCDDHLSSTAKRRKLERSLMSSSQVKCVPSSARNTNPVSSIHSLNKENHFESVSEVTRTLGARSCFGDSSSILDGHTTTYQEPPKMKKKRAKPGTKQKSKDRIQIAARLADLRELIPSGEKMSIDRLLHQTIKHLLFLQSVTKHAENSQRSDVRKFQQNGLVQKEKSSSSNGVTWACEVGNETMFCPLIVEDLSVPGQMLIEIICEEQGFFLEIVDIIRGFGLTILKGMMEVRESKLWAQFTVESEEKQQITRHEIFASLVQLLQLTGSTEVYKRAELVNPMGREAGLFSNCQQSCLPLPVSLANKSL